MNQKEWKNAGKFGIKLNFTYYNASHKLMKQFNNFFNFSGDTAKTEVHHLRDTEEQRKYNDEHYEMWGHNLDGTFEYGKYVIFVTHDEHCKIHTASEETRRKIGQASRKNWQDESYRKKIIDANTGKVMPDSAKQTLREIHLGDKNPQYGRHPSESTTQKRSASLKEYWKDKDVRRQELSDNFSGENNPCYGKFGNEHPKHGVKLSNETKQKIREANIGRVVSEETRRKISESNRGKCVGEKNGMYGKHLSNEAKLKLSNTAKLIREMYNTCVSHGSSISFKEFKHLRHSDREQLMESLIRDSHSSEEAATCIESEGTLNDCVNNYIHEV